MVSHYVASLLGLQDNIIETEHSTHCFEDSGCFHPTHTDMGLVYFKSTLFAELDT
jgi:hypothetical protein